MASAATSGMDECAGRERRSDLAAILQDADDEVRERPPCEQPESARKQRHEQRLAGDEAPDLARRRTERAQHRGLPPPLGDRERERPGDHEQRDRTGDPAHRAEDRDEPRTVGGGRVARVGICGVRGDRGPRSRAQTLRQSARSAAGDVPGSAMTPTALTRPGAPDSVPATVRGKNTAA